VVSDGDMEAYKAITFGGYNAGPVEVTFARRPAAKEAVFLAVFALPGEEPLPELKIVKAGEDECAFEVKTATATYTAVVSVAAKKASVSAK
jgi:hypothetical protein